MLKWTCAFIFPTTTLQLHEIWKYIISFTRWYFPRWARSAKRVYTAFTLFTYMNLCTAMQQCNCSICTSEVVQCIEVLHCMGTAKALQLRCTSIWEGSEWRLFCSVFQVTQAIVFHSALGSTWQLWNYIKHLCLMEAAVEAQFFIPLTPRFAWFFFNNFWFQCHNRN